MTDRPFGAASFDIAIDPIGIVRIRAPELATVAEAEQYIAALETVLQEARQRFGRALVLADLRAEPVRPQAVAERLRERNAAIYRPGERVALLVESSLLKMQLRRTLVPDLQNIFMSEAAAVMWLRAAG